MKKVVVITSRFPLPLNKGDKLRIYNHIRQIASKAKVYLICLYQVEPEQDSWKDIQEYCEEIHAYELPKNRSRWNALKSLINGLPIQVGYFFDSHLQKRIQWLLNTIEPDHIHCHLVRMVPYVKDYTLCRKSIDYMDALTLNDMAGQHMNNFPASLWKNSERTRIRLYEKKVHNYFDSHFIISERDRAFMDPVHQSSINILANGVQLDQSERNVDQKFDICFCGNLGYKPNIIAVRKLALGILPKLENVKCIIAGAEAPPSVLALESSSIKIISPVIDMAEVYLSAKIQVTPIISGSGQQNKILEAMVLSIPNITTSFVNESIGANAGSEVVICDSVDDFVLHIKELLSHQATRNAISQKAYKFVKRNFNWTVNTTPLIEAILDD